MTHTLTQPVITVEMKEEILDNAPRKQVGILGGTFNPPHLGHLIMAEQVGTQLGLDQVLFMPDSTPPHVDKKHPIAAKDRVAMVERAIMGNPLFGIELCEVKRGGISYTFDTMKYLKQQHPDTDYYFIIGGDMVAYLPKWHKIDELVKLVHFVGVKRRGYTPHSAYPVTWVDAPLIDISSTEIRRKLKQGCSVRYLVPEAVLDYIEEAKLYRD
ncbi:nicotinate-nucleotide adenylyltransferase (Deamido-NAD(+) pyrophosphorylase) [Lactobacillus selangorensis]|uniref:Probable nicotinate-nucleotide adenylyltransferase n=2 Tax=Lactobacillus selangorensis TaxID=81857 RepID=A0A0R2G1M4_9LACO|nr:nicotinate-nucleotide adenylyltransferase (Deamido-NAD(+) pyrophosphorylase) [Lactobacillus selangorensis]KRN33739.1 nicotinate-nucleotide adenylyltransferase (Deamido-NAD(+) pyrophosphorylase) [Lactobacillus selangorensis]